MKQTAEQSGPHSVQGLETGLEALRQGPEFRGPVETLDGHHCNDHFAQIYESDEERFDAAIPFIRHGLDQNDRCMYIVDESTEAEVKAAMRAAGLDVDAALAAGTLSFHTIQETYLRNGTFDPDEMIDFYAEMVADATEEYAALRIIAETTWLQEETTTVDQFIEYEARVNDLFADEDALAICQYDRDGFPPEIIRKIVRTHPHLIYNGTVCHNVYYTPPEEFFGADEPAREVDRMLETLYDRTAARTALEDRQRTLRKQNEIVASPDKTFEEKLQELFELGCERFGLELGAMATVDTDDDRFEVEAVSGDHEYFAPGVELPLSETYCTAATDIKAAGSVADPPEEGYDDIHVYQEFGIQAYLGTYIAVDGGADRTFFFVTETPRSADFSDDDHAFIRLMGQWVKYELERRQRERFLHESYQITSDPELSFEEKLERLLDLGCEWFGLEMAGMNHLPSWDGKFRIEHGVGLGVDSGDEPVWTDPGEGCFCRRTITEDRPVSCVDVRGTDWAHDPIYQEFGLTSYFGTKVMSGSTPYGTLWFGSTEPRDRPFSDTERTFIELIGQWVSYEVERREHKQSQRDLYEIAADTDLAFDEKLQALFDLGCNRFDLELGGIAQIDPATDEFEVKYASDDHDHLAHGAQIPLSETYCRVFANGGDTAGITDPVGDGFEGSRAYEEFGMNAYLGTRIRLDDARDRTLFFASSDPRTADFSEAERTFLHLMGQWVQHELEQHHRKLELRERTEYLSALIETAPECIKTVAADGTLLQMNPAGLDMVEADAETAVTGNCVYDLIAPEHRERFRTFNERICQGECGTLTFDIIGLEGTRRHMESHAAPLHRPDGTTVQVALTRDITEQVERESELERALDLLEKTEQVADVGGWEIDLNTQDVFWSDHIFELLEVDADEEPSLDEALDMYHEEDKPIVMDAVENALASGDPFDVEARIRTNSGEVRWLRLQGAPETADDDVVSLRGAAQDITTRKQREQRLEEVIEQLQQSNDRLKQFAYAASHDLQEPLRMVSSYLQLLEDQYREDLDGDAQEYIDFAVNGADRMREMVTDLLAFSRVEQADGAFEQVECDAILDRVLDDLQVKIEENNAEITVQSLPTVVGERSQLEQLFSNLVSNALKYRRDDPPEVDIRVENRSDCWEFSVADNGIGIDPDKTDRIFEVFKRLHQNNEYPGTGIGLSLCQKIAENHGGDIWVESEPGEGSTFFVTLPKQGPDQ
ncbi:MEDS domain-containing protein [Natrinema soli]|uniref:histidine kinase n=1 Tax=Natrinema soli TaxID=1930624 RepID=A0ABD5SJL2_9EURY|nr:MEDS domain-containing protein [Natrinema soli]